MGERRNEALPKFSKDISIILVNPEHDGNIGAVARTMLNFGITDLRVVGRDGKWSEETRNRAKNAEGVIDRSNVVERIAGAVSDC